MKIFQSLRFPLYWIQLESNRLTSKKQSVQANSSLSPDPPEIVADCA